MPQTLTFPGVYIEEVPSGVRPITGVATSITAFVGRALRGPVDEAIVITSYADFERIFGGLWLESNLGYAVQDFYRNGGSMAIIVRVHKAKANDSATLSLGAGARKLDLVAASPGAWGAKLTATIDQDVSNPSDTSLFNLKVTDTGTGKSESFRNVSFTPLSARRVDSVLANESSLVRVVPPLPTQAQSTPVTTGNFTNGNDGDPIDNTVITGGSLRASKKGLFALEKADLFNLLVIPPYRTDGDIDGAVLTDAVSYATERRAMVIVDPPVGGAAGWTDLDKAVAGAATLTTSKNAAVYFPRIREADPLRDLQIGTFAPSGAVAGVIARTDATRGVWKAPAGLDATLAGVVELAIPLTDLEIGRLNPLGVNCLRNSPGAGNARLGCAHACGLRPARFGVEVPARAPHCALPRGVALPRHPVGRLRAQRRAALGADPPERRRVHEQPLPPGRVRGDDSARGVFREVRCRDDDAGRRQPRDRQHRGRLRAAQAGRVRRHPAAADGRPDRERLMVQFAVNPQRFDPYKNFKFRVKWDGRYVAGISKVGALKRTTEVVEHREGGDPSSGRKSPGRTKYEAITLERGVTHDTEFESWANKVWNFGSGLGAEVSLKDFRKDVMIDVYNEAGQLVLSYKVYRAWVSEYQALPDLDANANAVAIQTIKLENEGLERDYEVPEPSEPQFSEP